ncbi:MAG: hypothetical protein U0136_00315 [Bdellovibrionota bacterium]
MFLRKGLLLLLLIVACSACKSKSHDGGAHPEPNALKEYVNEPKNKANDAKTKLERAQDAQKQEALDSLGDDDEGDDEGGGVSGAPGE